MFSKYDFLLLVNSVLCLSRTVHILEKRLGTTEYMKTRIDCAIFLFYAVTHSTDNSLE